MGPDCGDRRTPCSDLRETIKGLASCSTDVRLLTQTVSTLAEQFKRHMNFNDEFMPKIQGLLTQVALITQRLESLEESYKILRAGIVSIIIALIIAGIIAAIKMGGVA